MSQDNIDCDRVSDAVPDSPEAIDPAIQELPVADPEHISRNETNDGENNMEAPTTSSANDEDEGEQTILVNQLIKIMRKTIKNLKTENALLELRISDSDKHNKLLQLQIDIMMKKMELLEEFMSKVKQMDDDGNDDGNSKQEDSKPLPLVQQQPVQQICKRCKKLMDKEEKTGKYEDVSDSEDVDVKELMQMWGTECMENGADYQNPLLIDAVVEKVMEFLPIGTLLKCRLVNHLWCQEATYILKNKQTLTINKDNIDKLPNLLGLISASTSADETSPADCFLFRRVRFDINFLVKSYRELLDNFFKNHGMEIHFFSMHCDQENSSILYTEEVRNVFLPYLTNVQVLELSVPTKITERQSMYEDIRTIRFSYEHLTTLRLRQMDASLDIGGYSISVIKEILKLGPNLRSLGLETHTKEVVTRVLQGLSDKECRNVTSQLTELYLDAFITEEHLIILLPLEFKLKALQLSYFTVNVSSAVIEALLFKHRSTLQTLILGDYQKRTTSNSLPLFIKLPVLRELKHFKVVDPLFPDQRQIMINPLNYPEQLPCLKKLSFDHEIGKPAGPHYFQDMFVCSPPPSATLTTLVISHGLNDPQLVSCAAKMFPNLKKLELANAPDSVIQMVWREFPNLKVLYLELSPLNLNIDSLLTGIPDQVCRRVQERNLFSQVDLMNALDIIRTESSVCNLIELETLRIDGFASSLITAVTGYFAFLHMPNLTSISIKSDCITLSRECRRVLGERLHLSQFELF